MSLTVQRDQEQELIIEKISELLKKEDWEVKSIFPYFHKNRTTVQVIIRKNYNTNIPFISDAILDTGNKKEAEPDSKKGKLYITINPSGVLNASKIILPKIIENGLKKIESEKEEQEAQYSWKVPNCLKCEACHSEKDYNWCEDDYYGKPLRCEKKEEQEAKAFCHKCGSEMEFDISSLSNGDWYCDNCNEKPKIVDIKKEAEPEVCQNCKYGNNKKGKWKHTWKRKDIDNRGFWHIFCEKRNKYYPWDYRKRCIELKKLREAKGVEN